MEFFTFLFVILLCGCACVEYVSRKDSSKGHVETAAVGFSSFQFTYLVIYLIVMAADWLQGPYIYALYEDYGFQKDEIAQLFICGFFSSMFFGTFVGAIADKYGRKNMAMLFGVLYGISCITKRWNNFHVLMVGRLLSGIATSLLFSVFEAWMVFEHNKRGFSSDGLSQTFSYATFGNGVVAIAASLAASFVADRWGYVAPFMLSLALLISATIAVFLMWTENYGDTSVDVAGTFTNAMHTIRSDTKILILGAVQSLFEASMYTFVFMWTPALQEEGNSSAPLPFGIIFAAYMVSIMIGSSLFKIFVVKMHVPPEHLAKFIFGIAALALFLPTLTSSRNFTAVCFMIFEITCGMYWPCLGTIRGKYIPEASRAAIMNFFRIPLNLLVVIVLLKVSMFANSTIFLICSAWLVLATVGQFQFAALASVQKQNKLLEQQEGQPLVLTPAGASSEAGNT